MSSAILQELFGLRASSTRRAGPTALTTTVTSNPRSDDRTRLVALERFNCTSPVRRPSYASAFATHGHLDTRCDHGKADTPRCVDAGKLVPQRVAQRLDLLVGILERLCHLAHE